MASNRRSEPDGQLRITRNVYDLLVKAKRERNELRVELARLRDLSLANAEQNSITFALARELGLRED